jgi:hypothetical protein
MACRPAPWSQDAPDDEAVSADHVVVVIRFGPPRGFRKLYGGEDRSLRVSCALSLPESHIRGISACSCNSWQGVAILSLCEPGDRAMWIVMYVAMIASLSAMGMVPVAEYRDQLPQDDT